MPLRYQKTKGSCSIPFALREKQKYQVSNVRVKSKITTFASQRIIEFKQFLTRPNFACSVAKTDHRIFRFWCSMKPFQIKIDIKNHLNEKTWKVKSNLELETTKHMKNCILLPKTDSTSKFVTKETTLLLPQTPWQSMRWLNSPMSEIISVK